MSSNLTRRRVLTAGSIAAGAAFAPEIPKTAAQAKRDSALPFLTPWSPPEGLKRTLQPGKTPIRLASWAGKTTLDYPNGMSIADTVKRIRDAGYTSGNAIYRETKRNYWLEAPEAEVKELKDALKKYDVTFFDLHTVTFNIHPDEAQRRRNNKYVAEQCEAADRIGCTMVTTHTGTCATDSPVAPHKDNWTRETWRKSVAGIRQILKDSAGCRTPLGIEAVNMTAMNNPKAHLRLIEEIGDPRVKVCLDPVNMLHMGNYFRTQELIEECFELLSDHIIAAHAKDSLTLNRMSMYITEVAPGKGVVDYETYLCGLSLLKQPVTLIIEHIPDEEYAGAKKFIEDTAAKVGVEIYKGKTG
ncbi:MAG: sugar phosphate isomerase/epimerase family protein [Candidatus Latescibacterota bacterium]